MKSRSSKEVFGQLLTSRKQIKNTLLSTVLFFLYSATFLGLLLFMCLIRQLFHLVALITSAAAAPGTVTVTLAYRIVKQWRCLLICIFVASTIILSVPFKWSEFVDYTFPDTDAHVHHTQSMKFIYVPNFYPPVFDRRDSNSVSASGVSVQPYQPMWIRRIVPSRTLCPWCSAQQPHFWPHWRQDVWMKQPGRTNCVHQGRQRSQKPFLSPELQYRTMMMLSTSIYFIPSFSKQIILIIQFRKVKI